MPLQYAGILAEHAAVRSDVGVFDVSHLGRAFVDGAGAGEAIRSVTTYDVTQLAPGWAHYSLYCTEAGGIADDIFVYHIAGERWLVVHNAANAETDTARLRAAAGEAVRDETAETVMLAVQGPRALALSAEVLGGALADLAVRACAEWQWQGERVLVARTGYTGEDGVECIVGASGGERLWGALLGAGATPAGLGARDSLRLEAALPLHGQDISEETDPYAAGLGFAVRLDDGAAFTGREALVALKARGVERKLRYVRTAGRAVPRAGYALRADPGGEPLARLTSGGFSPTLRAGIGMAYLPAELSRPGSGFFVDIRGRAEAVTTVRRPFYRRS